MSIRISGHRICSRHKVEEKDRHEIQVAYRQYYKVHPETNGNFGASPTQHLIDCKYSGVDIQGPCNHRAITYFERLQEHID